MLNNCMKLVWRTQRVALIARTTLWVVHSKFTLTFSELKVSYYTWNRDKVVKFSKCGK